LRNVLAGSSGTHVRMWTIFDGSHMRMLWHRHAGALVPL
jgi:hypothetical protein